MSTYSDLVNIPTFGKKKEDFNLERWNVNFYCRDCYKTTEVTRLDPNKYLYECNECKGKNISIWTEESIKEVYLNG